MEKRILGNLELELRSLIAEILEIEDEKILPNAKFVEDLGMDSMMALEILASAEKKYKIKIPEEYLTKVTSLEKLTDAVQEIIDKNRIL